MEIKIYNDNGLEILSRDGKYFVRTDSGELVSRLVEAEISEEDILYLKRDEISALEVLIEYQNKGAFYDVQ